eukprot:3600122-Amphidinium_carterae.1
MWNRLLPGKFGFLVPMFRNDKRPGNICEVQDSIPKNRLQWIFFEHGNPKEWMSHLPDASLQVIFAANEAPIAALLGHQNSAPNYGQQTQTTPSAGPTYIQQAQSARNVLTPRAFV